MTGKIDGEIESAIAHSLESPRSFAYQVRLSTDDEKREIVRSLARMGRQTMNFRLMPEAQAIVLTDNENGGKIIGWQGFHAPAGSKQAEKFSLHLDPEYRKFLLGLALECAFATHLRERGFGSALLRMENSSNDELMVYRLNTGIFNKLEARETDPGWVALCRSCELFGGKCGSQAYFSVDLRKLAESGERRLGHVPLSPLPYDLVISPKIVRSGKREKAAYETHWAA